MAFSHSAASSASRILSEASGFDSQRGRLTFWLTGKAAACRFLM
jgi:hypothetical protein